MARQRGKEYYFAEHTPFEIGEVVALNRSDGRTKFGKSIRLVSRTNAFAGEALEPDISMFANLCIYIYYIYTNTHTYI